MKSVNVIWITLDPFRHKGPGALRSSGFPQIARVDVLRLQLQWPNGLRQTLILEGENPLATSPAPSTPPDLTRKTGQLVDALLAFYFVGSPKPHLVEIQPPHTLKVACEADTEIISGWATEQHILQSQPPSQNVLVISA